MSRTIPRIRMGRRPGRTSPAASTRAPGRYFEPPSWTWAAAAGGLGWWLRPGWGDVLLAPDGGGLKLDAWRAEGRLHVVKSGPHRVVYRVDLAGESLYIKHFLVPNWRSIFRQWVRRGKGRNEAKRAAQLADLGVPTIAPVALGERRRRNFLLDNYLITRGIPDAVPLDRFVEEHLDAVPDTARPRLRRRLAEALGEVTARLHEGGFLHNDFHPGNVLVQLDARHEPRLFMIDLDALRADRDVDAGEARDNLALLNHYFWTRASRADRQRFVASYLRHRRPLGVAPGRFALEIEAATRSWAERLWRRWGKRCSGSNKYFERYRSRRCRAVAARELGPATVESLLRDPDAPFGWAGTRLLKESRTTTVAEVTLPVGGRPRRVIYKRFNRKKFLDPIYTLFRPSRAWRAWQNGQHLASRGIPTPANLAVVSRSASGPRLLPHQYWPHDTYLVTAKAEPAVTLGDYAATVLPTLPPERRRQQVRRLTRALARLIRLLHERSLSHRDLKAANILIEGDPDAAAPHLSLIDLVGVQLEHPLSRHHLVQNLARLQLSLAHVPGRTRTDALRFLRAYQPWSLVARRAWKDLWREVADACDRKAEQNRRRNRKLS
jgi:tRNA A-37 threonylcarbamoyl transferase component Bud32